MPTIYEVKTFADIVAAVQEEVKVQSSDTTSITRIKRNVNLAYADFMSREKWKWARAKASVLLPAKLDSGTVAVTNDSTTMTLSSAPTRSRKGELIRIDGWPEVYRIAQHTAASATLTLETPYTGTTDTSVSYTIWNDRVALPAECAEIVEAYHNHYSEPMQGVGLKEYRRLILANPYAEGAPLWYSVSDYEDPAGYQTISGVPAVTTVASEGLVKILTFATTAESHLQEGDRIEISGASHYSYNGRWVVSSVDTTSVTFTGTVPYKDAGTASVPTIKKLGVENREESFREMLIHPAINDESITLHVDYVREVPALVNDADEPLIPYRDRSVLVYGALHYTWARERNETESARNLTLFENKISKMAGKYDESTDHAKLRVDRVYLSRKRRTRSRTNWLKD